MVGLDRGDVAIVTLIGDIEIVVVPGQARRSLTTSRSLSPKRLRWSGALAPRSAKET
jgi:hypothetical protein